MKKILLVAAAAMVMAASCEKTQIINPVEDTIGFDSRMGKLTKAEADNQVTLKEQGLKVWAFYAYTDATNGIVAGDKFDDMEALDVTWDATLNSGSGAWKTTKDYYWPGEEKDLNFFAVSSALFQGVTPALPTANIKFSYNGVATGRAMTVENYTVTPANATDDLMVADFVNQHQGQNGKKVHLNFHHALSRVTFKFLTAQAATENEYVQVNSISVAGLTTNGNLNVTETAEDRQPSEYNNHDKTTTHVSLGWTAALTPATGDFTLTKAEILGTAAAEYVTWLVIPQDIYTAELAETNKKVVINYSIKSAKNVVTKNVTFELGAETLKAWAVNQAITYTVNITPTKITFDPSVSEWDQYDADSSTTEKDDINYQN